MRANFKKAAIVGTVPAILEGLLIYTVESGINHWILIQSVLFWFTCGFVVYLIEVGLPKILSGILFTMFLCLPWYIAESVSKNKPEHLLPLIIASIIMGFIIGFLSKKLSNIDRKSTNQ